MRSAARHALAAATAALAVLAGLVPALALAAGPPFPDPVENQAVYDTAGVLRPETIARVEAQIDQVEAETGAAGRAVELADGSRLDYDYLVYAVGSGGAEPRVPGGEFTHAVATLEAARALRSRLDDTPGTAAVTVVGGGPTGIETAGELAERGRRVTLLCGGTLGPYLHPRARRTAAGRLARLGVTVLDGPGTKVTRVTREAVHLADGRVRAACNRVRILAPDVALGAVGKATEEPLVASG